MTLRELGLATNSFRCVAGNSGRPRFLARSRRQISARAVLLTIGPARNRLSATEVEIGITWVTDRPQAGRGPVSWTRGLDDRSALDFGNPRREQRRLRLSRPWRMANGRGSGRQLEAMRLADDSVLGDPQDISDVRRGVTGCPQSLQVCDPFIRPGHVRTLVFFFDETGFGDAYGFKPPPRQPISTAQPLLMSVNKALTLRVWSAFGGKADLRRTTLKSPLIARSGHSTKFGCWLSFL